MNNEELKVLETVINKLCPKFIFGCYDLDDIKQEARIMGVEAFINYNSEKGTLYTFLYTHIKNRLHTLRRDKHFRVVPKHISKDDERYEKWMKRNTDKQSLSQPSYLEDIEYCENHENGKYNDWIFNSDLIKYIEDRLDVDLLSDFRKIIDGAKLSRNRYNVIIEKIKEILNV